MNNSKDNRLARDLAALHPDVLDPAEYGQRRAMWRMDLQARMAEVNRREDEAWAPVKTVGDWERFRDTRLEKLRASLGFPFASKAAALRETGRIPGDGYVLRKVVYETHPGVIVSALLYMPEPLRQSMPAIQVCHAHHRPKDQGELQDMGVNWARTGAAVLIPDLVGHGERREDPFGERQGYYSRYYTAMQLALIGESLTGWMIHDIRVGNDLLLGLPGIDPARLILIGAVAGGGDISAIAAALDPRVTCSIPFNFGAGSAWKPEWGTPTPPGVNLAGWGYWETTRNLWLSARDGFLPWLIVAAAAPRHLVYAHEFAWEPDADPAWDRIRKVYDLYGVPDRLAWMKGAGRCAPGAGNTHCTNVGPLHREGLYPLLDKWFSMPPPLPEIQERQPAEALLSKNDRAREQTVPLREHARLRADAALNATRAALTTLATPERRRHLWERWSSLLGKHPTAPAAQVMDTALLDGHRVERILIQCEGAIRIPTLLFHPASGPARPPLVLGVARHGKQLLLERYSKSIAHLLESGIAVCLPDLRGMGEVSPDDMHGLQSELINCSEDERMLGRTALGLQFQDLRTVFRYIDGRTDLDCQRLALWGESLAPPNHPKTIPLEHDSRAVDNALHPNLPCGPSIAEPAGPALAILAALAEDGVRALLIRRGLASWRSIFDSYFFNLPSDILVPHSISAGDFDDLTASLAPMPIRIESPVDAGNRLIPSADLPPLYPSTTAAYADSSDRFHLSATLSDDPSAWLIQALG